MIDYFDWTMFKLSKSLFSRKEFDICIIGGGPSGFAAAVRAKDFNQTVCIIEKGKIGGAGLFNGALSSKTMWEISQDFKRVISPNRGYVVDYVHTDLNMINQRVDDAINTKQYQMKKQLESLQIPVYHGHAKFLTQNSIYIEGKETHEVHAKNFIIATGSRPRREGLPIDGKHILTSDDISNLENLPESIVIIGAGVIGCEFATIFSNLKKKVHIIDKSSRVLPFEDEDISKVVSDHFESKGVTVHNNSKLLDIKVVDGKVEYVIQENSKRKIINVEKALVSIGREPVIDNMNLEKIGLEISKRGITVHDSVRTSIPHIYATGDVTQDISLVNVGEIEARHAVEMINGKITGPINPLNYECASRIMFLDPEIAAVGMNETDCIEKKIPYKVATFSYHLVARAIAMKETDGFVKIIVSNDCDMRILGIRALGQHSSSLIEIVSMMIKLKKPIYDLCLFTQSAYPSITEGIQEAARMFTKESIHKPECFKRYIRLSQVDFVDGIPVQREL